MPPKFTSPRGTQDFLPAQTAAWQSVEFKIHTLAREYGYGEIRTPIFESTDLFIRGVGDATDIVEKEMYTFTDKGGRSITLRPELTAPVMRAAIDHNVFAQGAARLYYIGPLFRYERPQTGRYRQHHQFGVECTGFAAPQADVEVMALAWDLFARCGLRDVTLHLNSMGDERCRPVYRQALLDYFLPHRADLSEDSQRRIDRNPLRLLDSKAPEDQPFLANAPRFDEFLCDECRVHFEAVQRTLEAIEIPFVIDPRIVRGLDYYTRTVFEFVSGSIGAQSSVCSGGRYDDLVRSLGGPSVPAVGFGMGLERLLMAIAAAAPAGEPPREGIQAIALGREALERLVPIVARLRRQDKMPVFIDYNDRSVLAQLKQADRNNARFAVIVGPDELQSGEATFRDLESRTERRVPFEKDILQAVMEGSP